VTLFTHGPFTVTLTCTKTGAGTSSEVDAASTVANSVLNGTVVATANTKQNIGAGVATATTAAGYNGDRTVDLETPSGQTLIVNGASGVNTLGVDCWSDYAGIG